MKTKRLLSRIDQIIKADFAVHPFSAGITEGNIEWALSNYLAMSQAFPYLQAGAAKDIIFHCMDHNLDVPTEMECTSVVGSFLCWDEMGGHHVVLRDGAKALPQILNTTRYFHSNLLKTDLMTIMKKRGMAPHYSPQTRRYLQTLSAGLSEIDHVKRCASMVAFERHANQMISALWGSLTRIYSVPRNRLLYFRIHVGGDDPAEAYHVQMTSNLVGTTVPASRSDDFLAAFRRFYSLNYDWCQRLTRSE